MPKEPKKVVSPPSTPLIPLTEEQQYVVAVAAAAFYSVEGLIVSAILEGEVTAAEAKEVKAMVEKAGAYMIAKHGPLVPQATKQALQAIRELVSFAQDYEVIPPADPEVSPTEQKGTLQ